jgi:tetratricopeptide (TPR) repeat protein
MSPTQICTFLCALSIVLGLTGTAEAQTRTLSGIVETAGGKPLPAADVRLTNAGGTVSSDSGAFVLSLPPDLVPGDPIEFSVAGWIIISPLDGRTFVPRRSIDSIHLRVAHKGDSDVLTDKEVIQQIVAGVTSQLSSQTPPAVQQQEFLVERAAVLGVSVEQLKSAIDDWSKQVQEPYQKGLAALYARNYGQASQYIQQAINASENDLILKYIILGESADDQGHYQEAEAALTKARVIQSDNPMVLNNLGRLLTKEGKYAGAALALRQSLEIYEKAIPHPYIAIVLDNLAMLYLAEGNYTEAENLLSQALVNGRQTPLSDPSFKARLLSSLAAVYVNEEKYALAESLQNQVLAIEEAVLSHDDPELAINFNNLGEIYRAEGKYTQAEEMYKKALESATKNFGQDHPTVAGYLINLADLYAAQGEYSVAEPLFKQGLRIDQAALGADHPEVARDLNDLAALYFSEGKSADAEPLYKESIGIDEKALGPNHPDVARDLSNLALL